MPKKISIDRKGLKNHGEIQEEYLDSLTCQSFEVGQILNYAEETNTNEYNFIVTGITAEVIYLEAVPLSVPINKDETNQKQCNIVKNHLEEFKKE